MTNLPVAEDTDCPCPRRLLIAVHGYEPRGWAREVRRAVPAGTGLIQLLVVLNVPAPPFTSLLPPARRRYRAALAEWRRQEEEHGHRAVEEVLAGLPGRPDVIRLAARRADPGLTIAEHASEWGADVVVVGRDTRPRFQQVLFGAVHARVVQLTPCTVLVTPTTRAAVGDGIPSGSTGARQGGRG